MKYNLNNNLTLYTGEVKFQGTAGEPVEGTVIIDKTMGSYDTHNNFKKMIAICQIQQCSYQEVYGKVIRMVATKQAASIPEAMDKIYQQAIRDEELMEKHRQMIERRKQEQLGRGLQQHAPETKVTPQEQQSNTTTKEEESKDGLNEQKLQELEEKALLRDKFRKMLTQEIKEVFAYLASLKDKKTKKHTYFEVDGDHYKWTGSMALFGMLIYSITEEFNFCKEPDTDRILWEPFAAFFGIDNFKTASNMVSQIRTFKKGNKHQFGEYNREQLKSVENDICIAMSLIDKNLKR